MYDPALYRLTLGNVRRDQPDFYVMMGDDFSVDPSSIAAIVAAAC